MSESTARPTSRFLEAMIGREIPVLPGTYVQVLDYMGTDASIAEAARTSYGRGTKSVSDDRKLIRTLMRNAHTSPFEQCELKLRITLPMDAWRQMVRHRTAHVNEYSTRYSEALDDALVTLPGEWRLQSSSSKQGSAGYLPETQPDPDCEIHKHLMPDGRCTCKRGGRHLSRREAEFHLLAREVYQERLDLGVAREQARKDLPLSTMTRVVWKIDLHNLFHFLALRMDGHAQEEIRRFATTIGERIVSGWCPNAWQAFLDYRFHALTLSTLDIEMVAALIASADCAMRKAVDLGWIECRADGSLKLGVEMKANRERAEFEAKAARLGLVAPWLTAS